METEKKSLMNLNCQRGFFLLNKNQSGLFTIW